MTTEHKRDVRPIDGDRRFRMAFDAAPVGMALVDLDGRVLESNEALHDLLGYESEELRGRTLPELAYSPDVDGDHQPLADVLAGRESDCSVERRVRRKNGTFVWTKLDAALARDAGHQPRYGIGVLADITDRKSVDEQLLHAQKMATIGRLTGGVVHDINNLLTVIRGYSDFIISESSSEEPRRGHAEEIRCATDRAAALTKQLLNFSRQRAAERVAVDANLVVMDLQRMLKRLIGDDISLVVRTADAPCTVLADESELQQVILNLAVNARDAMPAGGSLLIETAEEMVRPTANSHITEAPFSQRHIRISISDTGTGIPADVRDRIFEPFYTTKAPGKGVGLGLSTVYTVVKDAGGFVRLTSEPRRGTTFDVLLPAVPGPATPGPRHERAARSVGNETLLLVEDDAAVRRIVELTLSDRGFHVLAAASGGEALRLAGEFRERIHAVVTDIVMPGISGPALVARLEVERPDIRVLYVSGHADEALENHGVDEDAANVLRKPFSPDQVALRVRQVLD